MLKTLRHFFTAEPEAKSASPEPPAPPAGDLSATVPIRPLREEPLPEETLVSRPASASESPPAPSLRVAQRCLVGLTRQRNEDATLVFTAETGGQEPLLPFGLYVVADGMGGHAAGHEASKQASRLVAQHVLERIYLPLMRNSLHSSAVPQEPIHDVMIVAIQAADHAVAQLDPEQGSGTTLTAALIFGRRLYVAHVGDSRAYLLVDGELKALTTDHSVVQRLQEAGQITADEAAAHPQRNLLYMAVGQGSELEIDTYTQSLPTGGRLLLCSDGLWGLATEARLQEVLGQAATVDEAADALVELALQGSGSDNITAVVVEFTFV